MAREGTEEVDVALVEDDEVLAQLVLEGLAMRGYSMRWIRDGDEAAVALGGARPPVKAALILLDWDLPARDGLTVLRGLHADGALGGERPAGQLLLQRALRDEDAFARDMARQTLDLPEAGLPA